MTDPNQPGQPSEEEIRAYLQQVREADPAAIIVQAYRMLGEGAELKLGRSDARVLIDAMAAVTESVGARLPDELAGQMREGVRQLQAAQVQAEQEQPGGAPAGAADTGPAGAPGGQPSPGQPSPAQPSGQPRTSEPEQKMTNRLWIPGRGPQP